MKRHTFTAFFYINEKKLRKNGEAPVILRIKVDGTYVESQIKRTVPPKLWDQKTESSKGRDKKSTELNQYGKPAKIDPTKTVKTDPLKTDETDPLKTE